MIKISISKEVGSFAENKDVAGKLRNEFIIPAIERGEHVEIDFSDVDLATQSFIHALIAEALRRCGEDSLQLLMFKSCSDSIRGIIETVVQYVLETMDEG